MCHEVTYVIVVKLIVQYSPPFIRKLPSKATPLIRPDFTSIKIVKYYKDNFEPFFFQSNLATTV
jgi:hypothetical protein